MFWVLRRTVSLRRSFEYPQHMFRLRHKKNNFLLRMLNLSPALQCLLELLEGQLEVILGTFSSPNL